MIPTADIGLIGLAVMGENLVLNMANHGIHTAVWNRTAAKTDLFIQGRAVGLPITGFHDIQTFCAALIRPRKVMILVKAGEAVDRTLEMLIPFLEPGDIIIDGGNSHYTDTNRRYRMLETKGFRFIGCGVSGGEEGALKGPSLMPGGDVSVWESIRGILESIAAKADDGTPCCAWMGPESAGHFVKMVHNGIEYGDMQLISEVYDMLKRCGKLSNAALHDLFLRWNGGKLNSYLIEITADIFKQRDARTGADLVDVILDTAGQKGTGKWTAQAALEMNVAAPTLAEAVFARTVSADRDIRVAAATLFPDEADSVYGGGADALIGDAENALYAAKICSYAQGFQLLQATAQSFGWRIDCGQVAAVWRGGCIIRAQFLDCITDAFRQNSTLPHLMFNDYFRQALQTALPGLRRVVAAAAESGIPVPALASALTYFDAFRTARLPANLLQAQRDFFGAHTYERIDADRGQFFHTEWQHAGQSPITS